MGAGSSLTRAKSGRILIFPRCKQASRTEAVQLADHEAGGASNSVSEVKKTQMSKTRINARIIDTLRSLKTNKENTQTLNLERIILKFGVARAAFDSLREIYDEFAEENGLTYVGLKSALEALGTTILDQDLQEIFFESDVVRDNSLSMNEFVVSLAIGHLLGLLQTFESKQVSSTSKRDTETSTSLGDNERDVVVKMFDLLISAYLLFDADGSGIIDSSEVLKVMNPNTNSGLACKHSEKSGIGEARIKELDINEDGTITFQEFVLTFQGWVGVDD
uniref:Uncharacterized protein AlNc14C15G1721 n=1 Tax=Albugo laibachii Nc14 TaxID=890382 RepID=F0W438_9STRA|nr:conserved hypothetical protein [Albugo laibachii Nc14]|eukprot:CCA15835.1 conserved hypothetical protein [Albugo laibachii Nc14]